VSVTDLLYRLTTACTPGTTPEWCTRSGGSRRTSSGEWARRRWRSQVASAETGRAAGRPETLGTIRHHRGL